MSRRALLWLIGIPTTVVGLVLVALDGPMWDAGGPGIVGFELAFTEERAGDILVEWDDEARDAARLSLWLDFLYLAGYGAFWSLASAAMRDRARESMRPRLAAAGGLAVVAAPAAAACDAVENAALLLVLGGHGGAAAPPVAGVFALLKFALIGFSVAYVLVVLAFHRRRIAAALATLAVAFVVVTVVVVDREEHGADDALTALADGRIRAVVEGDPRNPPLVLIHGYSADHHWWDRVAPRLAREFYVIRPDLLGHGASAKPREGYGMEAQADLLRTALRSVPAWRGDDVTVVGHSMGGVVAVALAERHPDVVARLMIIGTGPDVGQDRPALSLISPAFWPVTGHLARAFTPDDWVRAELEKGLEPQVDLSPEMAEAPGRVTWAAWHGSGEAMPAFVADAALDERVRRMRMPFAAVFGGDDPAADDSDRYRRLPGARVIELPGLGHSPQIDRPGLVARLIADSARLG